MLSRLLFFLSLLFSLSVVAFEHEENEHFPLGVRSGDPTDSGVVFWTRVNPQKCTGSDPVSLEVSKDKSFGSPVIKESLQVDPLNDYTLHVDLNGRLEADTVYFFRFVHNGVTSRTGRTKTLPQRDQERPIKLAVLTCQDYSTGYFNAHQILGDMAERGELDLAFFDGDFTYEYSSYDSSAAKIIRPMTFPSRSPSAMTAEDFRFLYQNYLSDPQLQYSLSSMPFVVIPDDHEVADNQFWDRERNQAGIPGKRYKFLSPLEKSRLMLDSRKAWVNYTPARIQVNPITDNPQKFVKLYRSFRLGKMADFFVTDSRSYRDGEHVDADDPKKTMLGHEQLDWFRHQLAHSDAHWRLWGNQTMFSRFVAYGEHLDIIPDGLVNTDQWNGFRAERAMLKQQLDDSNIHNLLILTGDMHTSLVSQVKPFDQPDAPDHLAVEFMTPSITSPNMKDEIGFIGNFDRIMDLIRYYLKDQNHHLAHFNSEIHGFAILTLNADEVIWDVYSVPTRERLEKPEATHVLQVKYRDEKLHIIFDLT
ncbi:alkaline phosphatase D family protein [Sansalvadorimonas sp. 2012CJ34-2]|uniref:Alkaline phosphatase D family protein n=1 Tax=Parendozoicomonas callyspongiae TaxID=2942213 RepID=A0ABT0PCQ7_9GAMM|nr:alkaline phosphatase D family protein [Sansalvadorimonas sp. 2012CJ34-2]MCL6269164.1 alkaline phosphatase D family protein [Sansalvadorimonas sp. 2012CJ34-2]